jgi:hypothetical protein
MTAARVHHAGLRALRFAGALALSLATGTASATPMLAVSVAKPPYEWQGDCRLCHQDPIGRAGTATQPFAESLKARGINAASTGSDFERVMDNWDDQDSDADGLSDQEELLSGKDPNRGTGAKPLTAIEYRYGCLNLAARSAEGSVAAPIWTLVLGLYLLWRRRSEQHPDASRAGARRPR